MHQYQDDLWYPIIVKSPVSNYSRIVEMQGKEVNEWNLKVRKQNEINEAFTRPRKPHGTIRFWEESR